MEIFANGEWLPLTFGLLLIISILAYAILDGYDLGVGILMPFASDKQKDTMIASIGPFWDANETWLVLAVGLLLIAFPQANGIVLTNLYIPVFIMLVGLILRGVSFDFRAKSTSKAAWDRAFVAGSLMAAISQGYMIGSYMIGFASTLHQHLFSLLFGLTVAFAFALIGATWLIMKAEGGLQLKAIRWAKINLRMTLLSVIVLTSFAPYVSEHIAAVWTKAPHMYVLLSLPVLILGLYIKMERRLTKLEKRPHVSPWKPFAGAVIQFILAGIAIAYSFFPYIVPGQLKIVDGASAPESLMVILVGALIVLPVLFGYTFFAYKIFHGKSDELTYN